MNFIDIHSHILNGVDDGAVDIVEAIEMCRIGYNNGTKIIFATPHTFDGIFDVDVKARDLALNELREELKQRKINIIVQTGFECHINENLIQKVKEDKNLTLANSGKYFLVECPHKFIPPNFEEFIFSAKINGFQPIIAHPERNGEFRKNIKKLEGFVEKGLEVQLTAGSIVGEFGWGIKRLAKKMLKKGIVHYVASDAHSQNRRNTNINNAYVKVKKIIGEAYAKKLFIDNPKKILNFHCL